MILNTAKKIIYTVAEAIAILKDLLRVPAKNIKVLVMGTNYIGITPSFVKNQLIYNIKRRKFILFKIRDRIDYLVSNQVFINEDYRLSGFTRGEDIFGFYRDLLSKGLTPLIFDIGANIGLSSIYFSQEFPGAMVVSVEPEKTNFELAKSNINGQNNTQLIFGGISNMDGYGVIENKDSDNWAFRTQITNMRDGEVPLISMQTLLSGFPANKYTPFIVKIDIEGFEEQLFKSNTEWVDSFPLLIIELHDWLFPHKANSQNFLKCISYLDRDFVYRSENVFSFKNHFSESDLK